MNIKNPLRLKQIRISGFKSISPRCPLSIDFSNINVLLGANGSGKSNIISFFKMVSFMMSGSFQSFVEKAGTSQLFLYYGSKQTHVIKAQLVFENDTASDQYNFELTNATPDRLIIKSEEVSYWIKGNYRNLTLPLEVNFKESALTQRTSNQTLLTIRKILTNVKVYQFHDSSLESSIRQSCHKDYSPYLQSEGNNLAAFLYRLKTDYPINYNQIVSYVRQIMPQFNDFYLEPNDKGYVMLKWTDRSPNDYVMLPAQFSDGTIRFIALATLLLQPQNTMPNVIIIDEPELGLHPFAITQLSEMIKEASMHTQVIIATQSPGLVDEFEAHQITIVERDEEQDTTIARQLNAKELADWLENYSLGELWDKNVLGGRP
ncbi:MAG: AAA family ATPase [Prevotellaceae bacterium]|jgi:predicted ATPase|nr:AAA family ATPase [Prevotellaceae bacterium]